MEAKTGNLWFQSTTFPSTILLLSRKQVQTPMCFKTQKATRTSLQRERVDVESTCTSTATPVHQIDRTITPPCSRLTSRCPMWSFLLRPRAVETDGASLLGDSFGEASLYQRGVPGPAQFFRTRCSSDLEVSGHSGRAIHLLDCFESCYLTH